MGGKLLVCISAPETLPLSMGLPVGSGHLESFWAYRVWSGPCLQNYASAACVNLNSENKTTLGQF